MMRFNTKVGAGALLGAGLVYLVAALASGHSAASQAPPEIPAREAGLDVWQGLRLVSQERAPIVDVRPAGQYRIYHLPGSASQPGAGAGRLAPLAREGRLLVVAATDEEGARLAGELRKRGVKRAHFLTGGARAWYLALELPVPLFNSQPPPHGYHRALQRARDWMRTRRGALPLADIATLSAAGYAPTMLESKARPASSPGKKKIAGGCG